MVKETVPGHIETTEALVRLYVFLTQYIDRCQDEAARKTYPEEELAGPPRPTLGTVHEITKVNPVVQAKVEKECERGSHLWARDASRAERRRSRHLMCWMQSERC